MEQATLIYNPCFIDNRGTFAPLPLIFGDNRLEILKKEWLQSNISYNPKKDTFRGMHLQVEPYAQTKLVKVINGSIIDFVIDLRPESANYMRVQQFVVSPDTELYVPKGFAHGFLTTEDNTIVQYLVDNRYSVTSERTIKWDSVKEIKEVIDLSCDELIVSDKDVNGESITDFKPEGGEKLGLEWQGKTSDSISTSNIISLVSLAAILTILIALSLLNSI